MKTNKRVKKNTIRTSKNATQYTHEGAIASSVSDFETLKRSVCACLLWENTFYEDGQSIADRISGLIAKCDPKRVADLAIECRTKMKLRHIPLFMAVNMWKHDTHKKYVGDVLSNVIQRADEPAEVLSLWFKEAGIKSDSKKTIPNQIKKGINFALEKFNEYQLSKYKGNKNAISLKDVILLTHPKRNDLFKKVIDGTIEPPMTWEVEYSKAGNDVNAKKAIWTSLISENKLGALAFLRNLRNMESVGVSHSLIKEGLKKMNTSRVLPFRFIQAVKHAPYLNDELEQCMFKCLESNEKLSGKTVLLVDVSGSMSWAGDRMSNLNAIDYANGLAILVRELCDDVRIFSFSNNVVEVRNQRGFGLGDAIQNSQSHGGTNLSGALSTINNKCDYDRLIVLTDEQVHSGYLEHPTGRGYIINVATNKNGVAYDKYVHVNGFSEAVIDYITEYEKLGVTESLGV